MDRFNSFKNYLSNINRSVLLAVGLVIVAGLIAATFIYGEGGNNDDASVANNDNNGEVVENTGDPDSEATNGSDEESDSEEGSQVEGDSEATEEQVAPTELADTGPAVPALAIMSLSTVGYFYRRSQKNLENQRESN